MTSNMSLKMQKSGKVIDSCVNIMPLWPYSSTLLNNHQSRTQLCKLALAELVLHIHKYLMSMAKRIGNIACHEQLFLCFHFLSEQHHHRHLSARPDRKSSGLPGVGSVGSVGKETSILPACGVAQIDARIDQDRDLEPSLNYAKSVLSTQTTCFLRKRGF